MHDGRRPQELPMDPWMVSREAVALGTDRDSIGLQKAGAGGMYGIWEIGGVNCRHRYLTWVWVVLFKFQADVL